MARKNNYVDEVSKHIGAKIQTLRLAQGYTRKQLSQTIGVTDQQLQKYELGSNIVSAGRLVLIAKALGQEVSYFYDGLDNMDNKPLATQHQRMCINVARNFMKIENPEYQTALNNLIKILVKAA